MDQADCRLDAKEPYLCAGHVPRFNTHPLTHDNVSNEAGGRHTHRPERQSRSCLPPAMTFLREEGRWRGVKEEVELVW
jgi:hypothetical protein